MASFGYELAMKGGANLIEVAEVNPASVGPSQTVLHSMTEDWRRDKADRLLNNDPAIVDKQDAHGRTALHMAAICNNVDMVEWLADHGANLEVRTANEKQTPLHYAARYGSIEVIQILLSRGSELILRQKCEISLTYCQNL